MALNQMKRLKSIGQEIWKLALSFIHLFSCFFVRTSVVIDNRLTDKTHCLFSLSVHIRPLRQISICHDSQLQGFRFMLVDVHAMS